MKISYWLTIGLLLNLSFFGCKSTSSESSSADFKSSNESKRISSVTVYADISKGMWTKTSWSLVVIWLGLDNGRNYGSQYRIYAGTPNPKNWGSYHVTRVTNTVGGNILWFDNGELYEGNHPTLKKNNKTIQLKDVSKETGAKSLEDFRRLVGEWGLLHDDNWFDPYK